MESTLVDNDKIIIVDDDKIIILITEEGVQIPIKKRAALISVLIQGTFEMDPLAQNIPLPGIYEKTARRVVAYLEHLAEGNAPPEIERPLRSNDIEDVVSDFMADLVKKDISTDELQDLVLAANYL